MDPKDVKGLIEVIRRDEQSKKYVDSILSYILPDNWGVTGVVRNFRYWLNENALESRTKNWTMMGFMSELEAQDMRIKYDLYTEKYVCTGIARVTSNAINREIELGNPLLKNIQKATDVSRTVNDTAHTATKIITNDGKSFVLDYHQTLNTDNPLIFNTLEDWMNARNGQTAEEYFIDNLVKFNYKELLDQIRYNTQQLKINII
ncbi:hypothetical protein [Tamlana flava]|uniref:hypothetical protein n=1 Tax=Tamlana flava TaxID=3158572 RepID=UPI00351B510C